MRVVPFEIQHFDLLELRPQELKRIELDPSIRVGVERLAQLKTGGTFVHDGRILGVMGWYEIWPGVIEVWAFPSIYAAKHPVAWVRTAKKYVALVEDTWKPRRLQSTALDDALHTRWMKCLGFNCETPEAMKNYYVDGSDARMWSKLV